MHAHVHTYKHISMYVRTHTRTHMQKLQEARLRAQQSHHTPPEQLPESVESWVAGSKLRVVLAGTCTCVWVRVWVWTSVGVSRFSQFPL